MEATAYQTRFDAYCLIKAQDCHEDENGDWIISGPLRTDKRDHDGHFMDRIGIVKGLRHYISNTLKIIDREHQYLRTKDPDDIVGTAIEVREVNGEPWLVGKLRKGNVNAQKIWTAIQDGIPVAWSLQGSALAWLDKAKTHVIDTLIDLVTLTFVPKTYGAQLQIGLPDAPVMDLTKGLLMAPDGRESMGFVGSLVSVCKGIVEQIDGGDTGAGAGLWKAAEAPVDGRKMTDAQAHYKDRIWHCRECEHWCAPNACDEVGGPKKPSGGCDYFLLPAKGGASLRKAAATPPAIGWLEHAPGAHTGVGTTTNTPHGRPSKRTYRIHPGDNGFHLSRIEPLRGGEQKIGFHPTVDKAKAAAEQHLAAGGGEIGGSPFALRKGGEGMTTGSGVVQPGDTGGSTLRRQTLCGVKNASWNCSECGKRTKGKQCRWCGKLRLVKATPARPMTDEQIAEAVLAKGKSVRNARPVHRALVYVTGA